MAAPNTNTALRVTSLTLLTIQNCALGLVMTQSRQPNAEGKRYKAATAVFVVELGKMIVSLAILVARQMLDNRVHSARFNSLGSSINATEGATTAIEMSSSGDGAFAGEEEEVEMGRMGRIGRENVSLLSSLRAALPTIHEQIFNRDGLQMVVPASLYVVQNNLQLRAAEHLSPTSFQVFSQFKIVTTAIFTVLYLKRHLVIQKWIAIIVLTLGVMIFQSSRAASMSSLRKSLTSATDATTGFVLIMVACIISGFAGTFTEKVLKGSQSSIWANNFQLSFFSLIPASLPMVYDLLATFTISASSPTSAKFAPFEAFGSWAWTVVALNVVGGLLVAMAVKYADSILKSFAASVAVILTFAITYLFMGSTFTLPALFGASLVIAAVVAYNSNWSNGQAKGQGSQYEALPTTSGPDTGDDMVEVISSNGSSPRYLDSSTSKP